MSTASEPKSFIEKGRIHTQRIKDAVAAVLRSGKTLSMTEIAQACFVMYHGWSPSGKKIKKILKEEGYSFNELHRTFYCTNAETPVDVRAEMSKDYKSSPRRLKPNRKVTVVSPGLNQSPPEPMIMTKELPVKTHKRVRKPQKQEGPEPETASAKPLVFDLTSLGRLKRIMSDNPDKFRDLLKMFKMYGHKDIIKGMILLLED